VHYRHARPRPCSLAAGVVTRINLQQGFRSWFQGANKTKIYDGAPGRKSNPACRPGGASLVAGEGQHPRCLRHSGLGWVCFARKTIAVMQQCRDRRHRLSACGMQCSLARALTHTHTLAHTHTHTHKKTSCTSYAALCAREAFYLGTTQSQPPCPSAEPCGALPPTHPHPPPHHVMSSGLPSDPSTDQAHAALVVGPSARFSPVGSRAPRCSVNPLSLPPPLPLEQGSKSGV
jgi:hypothetical protein